MPLLNAMIILFLIMDPIGNISSFCRCVNEIPKRRQTYVILREMFIALVAMLLFYFLGDLLLDLLGVSETTVQIAIGIILFLFAIKVIFSSDSNPREQLPDEEPFIIPLAVPLIAGPSLLATIMLFSHQEFDQGVLLQAIVYAWLAAVVILLLAPNLQKFLGKNGILACEKLMSMVLVLLAIQRITEGLKLLLYS